MPLKARPSPQSPSSCDSARDVILNDSLSDSESSFYYPISLSAIITHRLASALHKQTYSTTATSTCNLKIKLIRHNKVGFPLMSLYLILTRDLFLSLEDTVFA